MAEYLSEKDMNTGEYISREELLKSLTQECKDCEHDDPYWCEQCDFAIAMLYARHASKADVQPVKRGRWEETHISLCKWIPEDEKEEGHNFYMAELKCSCCERYNAVTFVLTLDKPDFCQLCGARMDGDTNG